MLCSLNPTFSCLSPSAVGFKDLIGRKYEIDISRVLCLSKCQEDQITLKEDNRNTLVTITIFEEKANSELGGTSIIVLILVFRKTESSLPIDLWLT